MRYLSLLFSALALAAQVEFPHGVASGDVTSTSVVLWTRTGREATVSLELQGERRQTVLATAAHDFTVKVKLEGLEPGRQYAYRFLAGEAESDHGSFTTAPLAGKAVRLKFAFSGDSDGTRVNGAPAINQFEVLDAIREERPDFFLYMGDTVYSDSVHRGDRGPAVTLHQYRETYQVNRELPALRKLLAATSAYVMWDDHEVRNDWDAETVPRSRAVNGRQAFLEYMPVEVDTPESEGCVAPPMFRTFRWGSAAEFFILDERSCRGASVEPECRAPGAARGDFAPGLPALFRMFAGLPATPPNGCVAALNRPGRPMLGGWQLARFKQALAGSTAQFKFVVSEVAISPLFAYPYDRWEGYAAERAEVLQFIQDQAIRQVIFLTADMHANLMQDVRINRFSSGEPVAQEFITGPIAAASLQKELASEAGISAATIGRFRGLLGTNCVALDSFGFGIVEVDPDEGTATITLKDEHGQVLDGGGCQKVLKIL